ncbi:MAG: hypothetical protein H0V67_07030 [Geodermatophilaceae bacterium]|nr:hypothetical protein [Geodermatophilaceae bacterium]
MALWQRERVTLVIESETVRLVGVMKGRVTRWGSAPLPPGTLDSQGAVGAPAQLAQVLERLWASQALGTPAPRDRVVLAIPGRHIASRFIPAAGAETLDASGLATRAREALPRADAYHAWQVIGASSRRAIFVVAAPTPLVDGYVAVLARAGLGVAAIDLKPLALIRGVGQRHAIIVDAERFLATIIIVDDALPRQVRFQPLDASLLAAPEEKIMRIAEVVHNTIQRYNEEAATVLHPAVPVFLTGSLAEHPLLRAAVQEVLRHTVGKLSPSLVTPPDMPLSQFLANLGLAQKQL